MTTADETQELPQVPPRRGPSRRRLVVAGVVIALAAAATAGIMGLRSGPAGPDGTAPQPSTATVAVQRGDIATDKKVSGTLGYGKPWTIRGTGQGMITALPQVGDVIRRGQTVYRVDDDPVPLLLGTVPLYRTLSGRYTVGRDVAMVATNLRLLGYRVGSQPPAGSVVRQQPPTAVDPTEEEPSRDEPSPGESSGAEPSPDADKGPPGADKGRGTEAAVRPDRTVRATGTGTAVTVRKGDGVLTVALIGAIKKWQLDQGRTPTGVLRAGDAVVASHPIRVDQVQAVVGDAADAPVLTATSTVKVVTCQLAATEIGSVRSGDPVTVELPDGRRAKAEIGAVSRTAGNAPSEAPADTTPEVSVAVALADPRLASQFDAAAVQVWFAGQTRRGVLLVPVGALVALREGGYAVQLVDGQLIAVTVGLFARGSVEVSGAGLTEGLSVVTTS